MLKRKPTVAIMFNSLIDDYQTKIWQGALSEAREKEIQLVTLMGGYIHDPNDYNTMDTKVFSLSGTRHFDGLIVPSSAILTELNDHEKSVYFQQFQNKPVISIGHTIDGIPSLLVDNYQGLFDVVEHLIKHHGFTRIGYISGPENSDEAKLRYTAYVDALEKNKIAYREDYVEYGNFITESGAAAMQVFLDKKNIDLEAVVCANDNMAFGAIKELTRRKIPVPDKIAVVGFDNIADAIALTPSLTTVSQPAEEIGKQAMTIMHTMLNGQPYKKEYINPTNVVLRQSCGCIMKKIADISTLTNGNNTEKMALDVSEKQIKKLYFTLKKDLRRLTNKHFIIEFNNLLEKDGDYFDFFPLLLTLGNMIKSDAEAKHEIFLKRKPKGILKIQKKEIDVKKYHHAEYLLHIADQLLSEKIEQKTIKAKLTSEKELMLVSQIASRILSQATNMGSICRVLEDEFPIMGLVDCYITSINEKSQECTLEFSLDNRNHSLIGTTYNFYDILPDSLWNKQSDDNLVIYPLYLRKRLYGYVTFSISVPGGHIYQTFSENIANAIQSAEDYERQINRSNNIQSLVWPMLNLIKEIAGAEHQITQDEDVFDKLDTDYNETIIGKTSLRIKEMLDFIKIINNISKGINLLAINSSIQASQAGKYAKTFKVVSEEIRRLSETTAENVDKIEHVLKDISKLITSIIEKMTELSENSNQILNYMSSTD